MLISLRCTLHLHPRYVGLMILCITNRIGRHPGAIAGRCPRWHCAYWHEIVVILTNFSSLAAPEVVILIISGAANNQNFVKKIITLPCQRKQMTRHRATEQKRDLKLTLTFMCWIFLCKLETYIFILFHFPTEGWVAEVVEILHHGRQGSVYTR